MCTFDIRRTGGHQPWSSSSGRGFPSEGRRKPFFVCAHFLDLSFILAILPLEANDIWDLGTAVVLSHVLSSMSSDIRARIWLA